jgi:ribonuclease BN (tRNA processing enzyme)
VTKPHRILIAEAHPKELDLDYQTQVAHDGLECLEKLTSFRPELVIVDLMLPKRHGIEIVKAAKKKNMGVIVTSAQPMVQNYHGAIENGADYFLAKPYDDATLKKLIHRFFEGKLKPDPFPQDIIHRKHEKEPVPHMGKSSYIKFWGTRGSTPVSGPEYLKYGGNTVCLEVKDQNNLVLIDAGTGIRSLGKEILSSYPKSIPIFISHTHWDHIAGLPFFAPIYNLDCNIDIFAPAGYGKATRDLFLDVLVYSLFPVSMKDLMSRVIFHELHDGDIYTFGSIKIETTYAYHPGSTLCFKITTPKKKFGYVTDNELLMGYLGDPAKIDLHHPLLEPHLDFIDFFRGCDTMIHEAQYLPDEYADHIAWGHSSVTNASAVLSHIKPKEWIVTHHNPRHSDTILAEKIEIHKEVADKLHLPFPIQMACDEFLLPL